MTARYVVTGCAGFIGSRVTAMLLEQGATVVGVDSLNDAYDVRLKEWRLGRLEGRDGFQFMRHDIRDSEAMQEAFQTPPDAVLNLAARAGVRQSVADPRAYYETNVMGALNLLELCRETGVAKFVQASTSSVYGNGAEQPFREDTHTDGPLSPYAASKKATEALCYTYSYLHDIDVTVFRYFTVYGPAGRPDMSLFRFVQKISEGRPVTIYGDGLQTRDFTYVDDIARGTVAGLRTLGFEVINLGSDAPVSVDSAIHMVEDLVGREAKTTHEPRHPADVEATWADIGKAGRLLGWRPERPLVDGLADLVRWYQDNREWARNVATD
jgi:nucleoside-diphosphate-sugar epimerase